MNCSDKLERIEELYFSDEIYPYSEKNIDYTISEVLENLFSIKYKNHYSNFRKALMKNDGDLLLDTLYEIIDCETYELIENKINEEYEANCFELELQKYENEKFNRDHWYD